MAWRAFETVAAESATNRFPQKRQICTLMVSVPSFGFERQTRQRLAPQKFFNSRSAFPCHRYTSAQAPLRIHQHSLPIRSTSMIWGAKVSAAAPLAPEFEPDVLRLTNAVIDVNELGAAPFVTQLFIQESGGQEFLLCTFTPGNHATGLNLEIDAEDSAKLIVRGPGTVHLTGHMDYLDDDDEDISSDESPVPMAN